MIRGKRRKGRELSQYQRLVEHERMDVDSERQQDSDSGPQRFLHQVGEGGEAQQKIRVMANVTELWQIVEALQLEQESMQAEHDKLAMELDSMGTDMDALWLMIGTVLVIFMQAGFAMLEVGSVSSKHTKNMLVKNILDIALAAVMWWSSGWGIAFGGRTSDGKFGQFVGPGSFFASGQGINFNGGGGTSEGYTWAFWLFQWSFSGTSITIVSGAVGERMCLSGYFILTLLLAGFIYPVVVRWTWNEHGWASPWSSTRDDLLFGCGTIDFAGSGVVHATGGVAALVMVVTMGPRMDRFLPSGASNTKPPQSIIIQTLGAFILWVGWFGFNGCSTGRITGNSQVAARAMVCTTISAAAATLGVSCASLILYQHIGPKEVINGILSGLVAITAGCAVVEVEGSFIIGVVAAINYHWGSRLLEMAHVDDMVNATAVHLVNGVWGVIAAGLFASEEAYSSSYYAERASRCCGWFYGCGAAQLSANTVLTLAILAWVGIMTSLVAFFMKFVGILRISTRMEAAGTDNVAHGGVDMPSFARTIMARMDKIATKFDEASCDGNASGGNALIKVAPTPMAAKMNLSVVSPRWSRSDYKASLSRGDDVK